MVDEIGFPVGGSLVAKVNGEPAADRGNMTVGGRENRNENDMVDNTTSSFTRL